MLDELPDNSHKNRRPSKSEKNIQPIEGIQVSLRKKPLGKRFAETFVGGDVESVWDYLVFDVMIPAAKDMFSDAIAQGVDRILFGESRSNRGRPSRRPQTSPTYVSYNRYSQRTTERREEPVRMSKQARAEHNFDEIVLRTMAEAREVLIRLNDLIVSYDEASVYDLYEIVGLDGNFTDEKWGWIEPVSTNSITRLPGMKGFVLDLPRPQPID